jgi:hypothetical protein
VTYDPERERIRAALELQEAEFDRASESMQADLDRLAESWRSGAAQRLADHEQHIAQMREDHQAWLRGLYADDGEGLQPTPVARGQAVGASAASPSPAGPGGPGPGQPDPRLAEAELAERIRNMPMNEFAAMRDELGVMSPTSMNRLFAKETR